MRAGRLNTLVNVTDRHGVVTSHWVEWNSEVPSSIGATEGLEQPATILIRHRNLPSISPGDWVKHGNRLLRVGWTGPSQKVRNGFESICTEYAGIEALYTTNNGEQKNVRVFVERNLDFIGEAGRIAETRHRLELLQVELSSQPQQGDTLNVGTEIFTIESLAPGVDDGILYQVVAV